MRPVSDAWADALASSHKLAAEISLDGEPLPFTGGSMTLDITAATRGRADITFEDPALIPINHTSELAPYDNELVVKRGLYYPDQDEPEMVQLGLLRVEETQIDDQGQGVSMPVSLLDRANRIAEAKFTAEYTITAGTDFLTAISNTVHAVLPELQTSFAERTLQTPKLTAEEGSDRWSFVQDMATAIGCDLYFDNEGVLVLRPTPDANGVPVAYLVEGEAGVAVKPTLLSTSKRWSRTDAHNYWSVTGDNPNQAGTPPRGVAFDDDQSSPTYFYGPFGQKPADNYSSNFITTDAQAQDAANGLKAKYLGTTQSIDFGALVNPALEPGDIVRITRTIPDPHNIGERIPIADELHVLEAITIPLTAGESMTGRTRTTSVTS